MPLTPDQLFKLVESTERDDRQFQYLLSRICVRIASEPVIRFYLDATPNFGHQANTVFVMRSIIDMTAYSRRVEIYVAENTRIPMDRQMDTLAMLMPGFDPAHKFGNVCDYHSCKQISFISGAAPAEAAMFGFTGGADDVKDNYAQRLNVGFFLRLQPYFWVSPNQIEMREGALVPLPGEFRGMIYQYNIPEVRQISSGVLEWYSRTSFGKAKMDFAQSIQELAASSRIRLWPMYGLHQLAGSMSPFVLLLMVCCAKEAEIGTERPVAVPIFNKEDCGHLELLQMLLSSYGEQAFAEKLSKWLEDTICPSDPDLEALFPQMKKNPKLKIIGIALAKTIFSYKPKLHLYDADHLSAGIEQMQRDQNGLFIFQCGTMPMDIFNCFYALSDLPCIYEGQGTASLAVNRGVAFMQLSRNSEWSYRDLPVNDEIQQFMQNLTSILSGGLEALIMSYDRIFKYLTTCIQESGSTAPSAQYFKNLAQYMKNPKNDKLASALVLFGSNVFPEEDRGEVQAVPGRLARLMDTMVSSIVEGRLDVLKALEETYIGEMFGRLTDHSLVIEVSPQDIVLAGDGSDAVLEIEDRSLSFLGMEFALNLYFRMEGSLLQSTISMTMPGTVEVPGIPWVPFSGAGLMAAIDESGFPMKASFCTRIPGLDAGLYIDFPDQQGNWNFRSEFDPPMSALTPFYKIAGGMDFLKQFPADLRVLGSWGIASMDFLYNVERNTLDVMEFVMSTAKPWTIPMMGGHSLGFQPSVSVRICSPVDECKRKVSFGITGVTTFDDARILFEGSFPGFSLQARLIGGSLSLTALLAAFGADIDLKTEVTLFSMYIVPEREDYSLTCRIEMDWVLFKVITIKELGLDIHYSSGNACVMILGRTLLLPRVADLDVSVKAYYQKIGGNGIWQIEGTADCRDLFHKLFGLDLPLGMLTVRFDTLKDERMFSAAAQERWKLPFGNLEVEAAAVITHSLSTVRGMLEADIIWENIHIFIRGMYEPGRHSFLLRWDSMEGEIREENGEWIGILRLTESFSVGSLVETMVSWVLGYPFGLDAPWNIINEIRLSGTSLSYNFTRKTVSLTQTFTGIDLGVASVEGICLSYEENGEGKKGVMVSLLGAFPWNVQGGLGDTGRLGPWDASKPGSAPVPNGSGNKYFNLTLLALGQHVDIPGITTAGNVEEAIASMRRLDKPEYGKLPDIHYCGGNGWLIGAELMLVQLTGKDEDGYMVEVQLVFNDPQLYALRVRLRGAASKVFAGLEFQILYRRLSDILGVYESEIILPDYIRYLNIGAYSVTLPVIGIAVYTNGDFRLDLGFPWNHDFARSFTFEGMIGPVPVTGSLGLYLAKLSGETSTQVPRSDRGQFNPVIEFGIGLRFGIGKSLELGPLKAGFSITVMGILEGVIAKWNPYMALGEESASQVQDTYFYKVTGLVGVIGNLYGYVDFCIIKAGVSLCIDVSVQFEVGSYLDTIFTVQACVKVEAYLEVDLFLFSFKIGFQFMVKVKETFVIENHGQAPWQGVQAYKGVLAGGDRLSQHMQPLYVIGDSGLCWQRLRAPGPGERRALDAYLTMAPVMASDEWNTRPPVPCYVAMLLMDAEGPGDRSFSMFVKTVACWLVAAVQPHDLTLVECEELVIDEATLNNVKTCLVSDSSIPLPIPLDAARQFLRDQFLLQVHTITPDKQTSREAVYFPMLPELTLTVEPYGSSLPGASYTFDGYNEISAQGIVEIRAYFEKLAVQVQNEQGSRQGEPADSDEVFSMADLAFCDYFLLVARQVIQALLEQLRCYSYILKPGETPQDVLDWIRENRGETPAPYTLYDLFSANDEKVLTQGKILCLTSGEETVRHHISEGETLRAVLKEYNIHMESISCHMENARIEDLFLTGENGTLSIPHLQQLRVDQLLKIVDTDNIAGMASRYSLHGMRLETRNIRPICRGMWVNAQNQLPGMAGLYAMTGQQFEIPDKFNAGPFIVSISRPETGCALVFCDLKPGERTYKMQIDPSSQDARQMEDLVSWVRAGEASLPSVDMEGKDLCIAKDVAYSLNEQIPVISKAGLRLARRQGDSRSLRLWKLPQSMIRLGRYSLQVVRYHESSGMTTQAEVENYSWSAQVCFKVRRTEQPCCYELSGAGGEGIRSLEKLLSQQEDIYNRLILGYPERAGRSPIKIDVQEEVVWFLAKSNLSTDTDPGNLLVRRGVQSAGAFIRLLWEGLITSQGGFYLYYQRLEEQETTGIPEGSFDDRGEVEITLLIVYNEAPLPLSNSILTDEFLPDAQAGLVLSAQSRSMVPVQKETLIYQSSVPAGVITLSCRRQDQDEFGGSRTGGNPRARLIKGYSLLSYSIRENEDFEESPLSLPVSGTSLSSRESGYRIAIPYLSAAKNPDHRNLYSCIGKEIDLLCYWQDYYGNRLELPQHRRFLTGYTDSLIGVGGWPSLYVSWAAARLRTGTAVLRLIFVFEPSRFAGGTDESRQAAENAVKVYSRLFDQLNDPNGVRLWVSSSLLGQEREEVEGEVLQKWLFNGRNSVISYLKECAEGTGRPVPPEETCEIDFEIPFEKLEEQQLLLLTCAFSMERRRELVMSGFEKVQDIAFTSAAVLPYIRREQSDTRSSGPLSLDEFASDFERIFYKKDEYRYLLAVSAQNSLYGVRQGFATESGFSYGFNSQKPVVLIPRPYSNVLESRQDPVPVPDYVSGEGLRLDNVRFTLFTDIDLDAWIRMLLEAVDTTLSPAFLGSTAIVDSGMNTAHLERLTSVKRSLAHTLSRLLYPVFEGESTPHLPAAVDMVEQQMLRRLSDFYSVQAVLGYDIQVYADFRERARLSGTIYSDNQGEYEGLTLRPGKISLQDDRHGAFLCLVTMPDIAKKEDGDILPSLTLRNLRFRGAHIEHSIEGVPDMGGYESSRWMRFILEEHESDRLTQTAGDAEIPLIFRAHPESPSLTGQFDDSKKAAKSGFGAISDKAMGEKMEKAGLWDWMEWSYGVTYTRPVHYPQDSLEWQIRWNIQTCNQKMSQKSDYFTELAKFITLYPLIQKDLEALLPDMRADASKDEMQKAHNALESLCILAENAAAALAARENGEDDRDCDGMAVRSTDRGTQTEEHIGFMTQEYVGSEKELVVRLVPHDPEGWGDIRIPVMEIEGYHTEVNGEEGASVFRFRGMDGKLLPASEGQRIPGRKICVPKLSIVACQNALAAVELFRNRNLVENRKIKESFIYRTGMVSFGNPLYLSRDVDQEIDITTTGGGKKDRIEMHLTRFFAALLGSGAQPTPLQIQLQMECHYCYRTNQYKSNIEIPVFMQIPVSLMQIELGGMIKNWSDRIAEWRAGRPDLSGWSRENFLRFKCTLLTALTENPSNLLRMENLVIPGEKISG